MALCSFGIRCSFFFLFEILSRQYNQRTKMTWTPNRDTKKQLPKAIIAFFFYNLSADILGNTEARYYKTLYTCVLKKCRIYTIMVCKKNTLAITGRKQRSEQQKPSQRSSIIIPTSRPQRIEHRNFCFYRLPSHQQARRLTAPSKCSLTYSAILYIVFIDARRSVASRANNIAQR